MINDIKDLKQLFKLCRQQGVTEIKLGDTEIKFGEMPMQQSSVMNESQSEESPYGNFPSGELTPEQLMFYSSGGRPEDDPALKDAANA